MKHKGDVAIKTGEPSPTMTNIWINLYDNPKRSIDPRTTLRTHQLHYSVTSKVYGGVHRRAYRVDLRK